MIKKLWITILILLFSVNCYGDIEYDSSTAGSDSSGSDNTHTISHTLGVASGNNRIVSVSVTLIDNSASADIASCTVTYDGESMTQVHSEGSYYSAYGYYWNCLTYYILDADLPSGTGSYNVVATGPVASINAIGIQAISIYNAEQQAPEADEIASNSTTVSTINQSITTLTDDAWIVTFATSFFYGGRTLTWGTGQTERYDSEEAYGISTEELASAGADTQSFTFSSTNEVLVISSLAYEVYAIESYTDCSDSGQLGNAGGDAHHQAQSFQLDNAYNISDVAVKFASEINSPTEDIEVRIETDNSGEPSGTLVNVNATTTLTPVESAEVKVSFSTPFSLNGSTTYWLVLMSDETESTAFYTVSQDNTGAYSNGFASHYYSSAWDDQSEETDLFFKIYGELEASTPQVIFININ